MSEIRRGTTFRSLLAATRWRIGGGRPFPSARSDGVTRPSSWSDKRPSSGSPSGRSRRGGYLHSEQGIARSARLASEHDGGSTCFSPTVMPEMNGRDLAHALAKGRPASGAFTCRATQRGHHRGGVGRGSGFIQKPFSSPRSYPGCGRCWIALGPAVPALLTLLPPEAHGSHCRRSYDRQRRIAMGRIRYLALAVFVAGGNSPAAVRSVHP
jgi:hypothetical protein